MKKRANQVLLALAILSLGGAILVSATAQERPDVTKPEWAVRFEMGRKDPLKDPLCHVSLVVRATCEGEAVMKAIRYLQMQLAVDTFDRLNFYDAQERK